MNQVIQTREEYSLHPIGHIRSTLRALHEAPRQGSEGAPDAAWLEANPTFARGLFGIAAATRSSSSPGFIVRIATCSTCTRAATPRSRSPECSPHGLRTDRTRWGYIA